jgi:AGZA family xanthine/uracil permease-like MFS transporter
MLERLFRLSENRTTPVRELRAGVTTFLAMAYIVFVQPAVLAQAGMPHDSVFLSTCLSAAVATILMGLLANYPIALAPGMGNNFFFVFSVALATVGGVQFGWQAALGVVFISGLLFLLITVLGIRRIVLEAVPPSLRHAMGAGIGVFIALIGLQHGGIVDSAPGTMIGLGSLASAPAITAVLGLLLTGALVARGIRGGILLGMLGTAGIGLLLGVVEWKGAAGLPNWDFSVFFAFDLTGMFRSLDFWLLVFLCLVMDVFDTMGTLVAVGTSAGIADRDGNLPRSERAFLADALGTVAGAAFGNSTVTSYIESGTGVQDGARTGLANMATAACFLLAIFFAPLAGTIGGGYAVPGTSPASVLYPVTAPALILVGALMLKSVVRIEWDDLVLALPSFLVVVGIAFTYSIANGIGLGLVAYAVLALLSGRGRQVHPGLWIVAVLFVARFIFQGG